MWELIKDLLPVSLGMGIGVVLMCIMSVGKEADRHMIENKRKRGKLNEFRTKFIYMVFKQRTVFSAYGNRRNWYLLRVQA